MKENRRPGIGLNGTGIIKSVKQRYREAEMRIGELERDNEKLKNYTAYLVVVLQALGKKYDFNPAQAKAIADDFIAEEQAKFNEKAKQQLVQDIKDGKTNFKIISRDTPEPPSTGPVV